MRIIALAAVTAVAVYLSGWLAAISCDLINSPSDMEVIAGLLGLSAAGLTLYVYVQLWRKVYYRYKASKANKENKTQ